MKKDEIVKNEDEKVKVTKVEKTKPKVTPSLKETEKTPSINKEKLEKSKEIKKESKNDSIIVDKKIEEINIEKSIENEKTVGIKKNSSEKNKLLKIKQKNTKLKKASLAKKAKEDQKIQKLKDKKAKGKILSSKEREKLRLSKTKMIYKYNKEYALRLKSVKKSFRGKKVLQGVSFDLKKGERLALIGKNGSGKSTLINVISQQLKMSEGKITYGYANSRLESLELMGIQFQTLNYPEGFIVKDVIHFFNVSVEKSIRMSKTELFDMVSMFGIDKFLDQKIDRLSGGQQQRVNILLALIKSPKLLILDEISTGLDIESSEVIKEYIKKYLTKYSDVALLLISHSDEEIRALTNRTIILEAGKIVEDFESNKLTNARFLKITSREPNLTKAQKIENEKESNLLLKKLSKSYRVKEPGFISNFYNKITSSFMSMFPDIDNSNITPGNIIEINDVSKTYGKKVGAVRNLTLDIKEGERVSITGPNGSGKSTIVEIIAKVKTLDNSKYKFINMKNLAKADYERKILKLEENVSSDLRKSKKAYRLERELSEKQINDILNNKKTNELSTKNTIYQKQEIEDEIKSNSEAKIKKMKSNHLIFEKKLAEKLVEDKKIAKENYEKVIARIGFEQREFKHKKGTFFTKKYLLNDVLQNEKKIFNNKPKISYSFTRLSRGVKDESGVQFQYASFPVEMSVLDVILFFARTNKKFMSKEEIIEAVKVFKLENLLKSKAYRLSGGEKQRLNVLLAIMKSPKLLILDEISTGLDVDSIVKIDKFISEYLDKTKSTLILISHNYHEVHSLTDRIIVMKYGELSEIIDTKDWKLPQTKAKMRDIYKGSGI